MLIMCAAHRKYLIDINYYCCSCIFTNPIPLSRSLKRTKTNLHSFWNQGEILISSVGPAHGFGFTLGTDPAKSQAY